MAQLKHSIGAVVMPAPICPTPAFLCAIPVLMIGKIPESTTSLVSVAKRKIALRHGRFYGCSYIVFCLT